MSFKSVMGKIGKVALTAAPYVAAPFTGGASLQFAPMTNQLVNKWNEHDAKNNAAKGLAPSSFDKYLGIGGNIASMVAPLGGLGKFGKASTGIGPSGGTLDKFGKAMSIAGPVLGGLGALSSSRGGGVQVPTSNQAAPSGRGPNDVNSRSAPNYQSLGSTMGDREELRKYEGISSGKHPIAPSPMGNPDLYSALRAGSRGAVQDQGFRRGYDVRTTDEGDPETITTTKMPKISSSYARYANQQNPRRQAQGRGTEYAR